MITLSFTHEQAAKISYLYTAGFFDLKRCTATVEFDAEGTPMEVRKTEVLARRGQKLSTGLIVQIHERKV